MAYQFFHMLLHIGKTAKDAGYQVLQETGINPAQAWLLDVIARFGPLKQAEAASILNVRLPAVSRMVKGMEKEGLVFRERSPDDDRVVLLSITPRSEAYLPGIRAVWSSVEDRMMTNFSQDERNLFKQLMIKAAENLIRES